MKKIVLAILALFLFLYPCYKASASEAKYSTKPINSSFSKDKWRIGYVQGGDYVDYKKTLLATVEGLIALGWIEPIDIQNFKESNIATIWKWLADESKSEYLSFVKDAFYSAEWQSNLRKPVTYEIAHRIEHKKDIDLIIAMGTWAGQDLSKRSIDTSIIVMTASDPVASGIITSPLDSGAINLHAHTDPTFFKRQIRLFHDLKKFKKLGIILENSGTGRSYAGIDSIEPLSKELDFEIVTCFAVSDISNSQKREEAYLDCVDKMASQIDALYVTAHGGVSEKSIPIITERSTHHRLPTFSQSGSHEVEMGLLMSLSRVSFKKVGLFQAAIIAKVFNGAKPGELNQIFEEPLSFSFNLSTAEMIGYIPSADAIAAADQIFHKTKFHF